MRLSFLLIGVLCAGLAACSRQGAGDGAPAAPAAPPADAPRATDVPYEVVTVDRPESVDDYHKLYRASYEMCASVRKLNSLPPPPPMKEPPPDYIVQRNTHISDGKRYFVKQEYFNYEVDAKGDAPSCETRERKSWSSEVQRDGMVYHAGSDGEGPAETSPPEEAPPPDRRGDGAYSLPKTVKGIAVKCMPLSAATDKLLTEQCALDLKPGTLYFGSRPIVVSGRVTIVQNMQGAMLTEPVLVRVGHQVDGSVFDVAGKR